MAQNIFDQYGLKEVADVQFEALSADAANSIAAGDIVLYLDTLKVSTIETTASVSEAKGGRGGPSLIMWDYGKEITLTLEDALFTMESMRIMLGGKLVQSGASTTVTIRKTKEVAATAATTSMTKPTEITGTAYKWINLSTGTRGTNTTAPTITTIGERVRYFWDEAITTSGAAIEIVISPSTFPGTYKVIGDTLIRNRTTQADEAYQFVINKAKVNSEVTLTMEAEGDPTTFNMSLRVLKDDNGNMMSLKKY